MSSYKTVRGKQVIFGGITLTVLPDGSLVMNTLGGKLELTEGEASALYDLMADVMQWESSRGTTEGEMNRMGDKAEDEHASGKDHDERAHDGR